MIKKQIFQKFSSKTSTYNVDAEDRGGDP